jgi:hypothetical protein
VLPYLGQGSVGIGLVIGDYLAHRHDERFAGAAGGIRLAASSVYYAQTGLFNGRAGMILYLAGREPAGPVSGEPVSGEPVAAEHVRRLGWHAVSYRGGIAFPGDNLYRLSMDLATGTAGVLLSAAALARPGHVGLPFLGVRPPAVAPVPDPLEGTACQGLIETSSPRRR